MDILIIGNGFDLAHGLKTSYKDFLEHCSKVSIQDFQDGGPDYKKSLQNNLWLKHFITRQNELGDTWIDLENEIHTVFKKINGTASMSYAGIIWNMPKVLRVTKHDKQFTFFNLVDLLKPPNDEQDVNEQEYTIIKETGVITGHFMVYIKTPKGFVNFLYDQLRDFTEAFERYLIKNITLKLSPYRLNLPLKTANQSINLKVISFNYTNTCEALYHRNLNKNGEYDIETIYIHGKANKDNCNLVLGTKSFSFSFNSNIGQSVNFSVFQKHNQRHKYGTIETYQDFLKEISNPKKIIDPVFHVIGHSLDETDHKVLNHIFDAKKDSAINIYYHTEEAQDKLIANITEIIGEAEVMKRVRLIHQHDDKRSILIHCK